LNQTLKLAIAASLLVALATQAQQVPEASVMNETNVAELTKLQAKFAAEHAADEAKVRAYLAEHGQAKRSLTVDGQRKYLARIDADGKPVYIVAKETTVPKSLSEVAKNKDSGILIKADSLYPGGSLGVSITGTGMVAGIWDEAAVRDTHELLAGSVANQVGQSVTLSDHMTHVTGTVVGKDIVAKPEARGVAYTATSLNYDWTSDKPEMTAFAATGKLISNHSYGYGNGPGTAEWLFGAYDSEARAWDEITKAAPYYLPFVAAGNEQVSSGNTKSGYDIITGASASKNAMTVGAVNGDKTMSAYSNWGPTDDGRVKPEIVTRGTGITSSYTATDSTYSTGNGTSFATPAATGAALLLQQYYKAEKGVFMKASTLKTLMMGTAEDLGRPGPDHQFGYGLLNVEAAALAIKKAANRTTDATWNFINSSKGAVVMEVATNPVNNEIDELIFDVVAKGGVPLVVNMGWTDDEGTEQVSADGVDPTTSRLVYNFDMLVRNQTVFAQTRPWVLPNMANRTNNATAATAYFQANGGNFRQVIFPTTTANHTYRIYVKKSSSSPAAARMLSFVITGLAESSYTVSATAGANGSLTCGTAPVVVPATNTATCTATPNMGYRTRSMSGCTTVTGVGVNSYTTGPVTANCTVNATFELIPVVVNGVCGAANNVPSLIMPSAFCSAGTASPITTNSNNFAWTCNGSNGGASPACSALRQFSVTSNLAPNGTLNCPSPVTYLQTTTCTALPSPGYRTASISGCGGTPTGVGVNAYTTGNILGGCNVTPAFELIPVTTFSGPVAVGVGTGSAAIVSGGGANCSFDLANTNFIASTAQPPSGSFSQGWFRLRLMSCTSGSTVRVSVTYPNPIGPTYLKYGRTAASPSTDVFYTPAGLVISGNTATFDLTDGGLGDNDLTANGVIVDPSGPVRPADEPSIAVPTLQSWHLLFLALSILGFVWRRQRS
jgi:serine protease AprX